MLEKTTMDWFQNHYMGDSGDPADPRAAPLLFPDFAGLAPAHIQTAGYDPLRDEGAAYAEKMAAAGVAVDHKHHAGLLHGYFNMTGAIEAADAAFQDGVAAVAGGVGDQRLRLPIARPHSTGASVPPPARIGRWHRAGKPNRNPGSTWPRWMKAFM